MDRLAAAEPRRSARLQSKRARDASPPAGRSVKPVTDAETSGDKPAGESETEEGGAYDVGAEFTGLQLLFLTPDERISRWRRLNKKRANMSLVFYHKSHPDRYEFTHVRLNDVFDFIEGYFAYLHMNFKARNVATGSEQIFFSELMAEMDSNDNASNGYYRVSACDIVDGNSAGGRKKEVECKYIPGYKNDMENCYVCAEKIKHPVGSTYKGGHSVSDYGVEEISTE
ncbi:hypothetical protein ACQJBY_049941 [Aegilops geniculata]